jgi:hypothetical protein
MERNKERRRGKFEKFERIRREWSVLGARRHRANFKCKILKLFPLVS